MTTTPFCAQCLSDKGPFTEQPWGKDGALVQICDACENEHPRKGRYSFSEATRLIAPVKGHHTKTRR